MLTERPIAVLGAGSWGTALAILLADNGQTVHLWGHNRQHIQQMQSTRCNTQYLPERIFPPKLAVYEELSAALFQVEDIVIVVPSHAFSTVLQQIKPLLSANVRIVWGTKGLESGSGQFLHVVAEKLLGRAHALAILSGPSFAKEVALKKPTAVTLASLDHEFAKSLSARLNCGYFRVYTTSDVVGVEICGAVKNILAIAAGIIDGMELGMNALSALITRGLTEMRRLGITVGGKPTTFMGLAGVGDLVLTCTGTQSRNRRFGKALALGKRREEALNEIGQVVEGLDNLKEVYQLAQRLQVEMPIVEQMYNIIYQNLSMKQAIENLFTRQPKEEE